jgi:signal transduction histidine kinase
VWSEPGGGVAVTRLPHFYERGWFYIFCAAIAGALGWVWHRQLHRKLRGELERLEQKHAMEKERRRIARNLHDDLGASLAEIGMYAEAARRKTAMPEAAEAMSFVSARIRSMSEALDAVVWSVNPANDSLNKLTSYLCEIYQDLFAVSAIRGRIDLQDEIPPLPLNPEERANIFLTVREAMNNVLKHSGASEVWLRIKMDGPNFQLSLEDNGRGFDPTASEHLSRNGLSNMRSRIAELGGVLDVQSTVGRGTILALSIHFGDRMPIVSPEIGRLVAESPPTSSP